MIEFWSSCSLSAADQVAEFLSVGAGCVKNLEDASRETHQDPIAVGEQLIEVGRCKDDGRPVFTSLLRTLWIANEG